jgi:hypothetical protein
MRRLWSLKNVRVQELKADLKKFKKKVDNTGASLKDK